ncbi:MAG TPA: protein kinase [Gemmataceae bacterium]|nr:protein kinase [Gemmataceae bacterium]
MPIPSTSDGFLALVRKSGVADAAALDAWELEAAGHEPETAQKTALSLIRDGILTRFQAGQLLRGKWREFFICEKYKLLEHLGTGGMGHVYLCDHIRLGRRVAIKFLPADKANDQTCLARFEREARAAATVDHRNIVRAHDIDRHRHGSDVFHFLVMEYVDGSNLQYIVDKLGPLTIERACHYIRQAADGLQHAHEVGLVHRDIKPANLLLDRSGTVKILDLGLVRFFHDDGDDLTKRLGANSIIGTADYLAPEQAVNCHAADIRADIYSLGVTFYFLLTGRSPFKGGSLAQKLIYQRMQPPEPVRNVRPDIPDGVARIIDKMLAKYPADRYQQPSELRTALEPWTDQPIPPPPEAEMPRLSRAVRRSAPSAVATAHGARQTVQIVQTPRPQPLSSPAIKARPSRFRQLLGRLGGWFRRSGPANGR